MGMFDFLTGNDAGKYFDEASDIYKQQEQQILDMLKQSGAMGRQDIIGGYNKAYGFQEPYLGTGKNALADLMSSIKNPQSVYDKFSQSPDFQYALKQGMQEVQRNAAAKGLSGSGAEMAALQERGQGLASQNWQNYFKNYQDRLSDLAGMGQKSALFSSQLGANEGSALSSLGLNYANLQSSTMSDLAKALAEARMGKGTMKANQTNSLWGALGNLGGGVLGGPGGGAIGNWLSKKLGERK